MSVASATIVDSNVLLDLLTGDPEWAAWSTNALRDAGAVGALVINPLVYAEVAPHFERVEDQDDALPSDAFLREAVPWEAAFLAGRAFLAFRRRGGRRTTVLPDFLIGAHAAVRGYALLTRDPRRYRQHYPTVRLISPS